MSTALLLFGPIQNICRGTARPSAASQATDRGGHEKEKHQVPGLLGPSTQAPRGPSPWTRCPPRPGSSGCRGQAGQPTFEQHAHRQNCWTMLSSLSGTWSRGGGEGDPVSRPRGGGSLASSLQRIHPHLLGSRRLLLGGLSELVRPAPGAPRHEALLVEPGGRHCRQRGQPRSPCRARGPHLTRNRSTTCCSWSCA